MPGQQNWVGIPCYIPNQNEAINNMFLDSLHNEIILNSNSGYKACNTNYKGVFAYNGSYFRDLDYGLNKHNPNSTTGGDVTMGCIPYFGKTLFGGAFSSVGSNTLNAEAIALWNGATWDTFPKHCFKYNPNRTGNFATVAGFLRHENKLWIYGGFDSLGGVPGKNLYSYDGNNFTPYTIPVSDYNGIFKMITYKNKLIAGGPFYDNPSMSISRLAMYDGTNWTSVGNGIKGSIAFVYDMLIYKDTLYIAGSWAKSSGNVSNHIMKWDGNQLYDAGFGNFYGWDVITSLIVYKDRLFALGSFGHAANQKAWGVAYYQNGKWTVPQDSINNYGIRYGIVYNNELYIAGGFKNINNDTTIKNFAKLRCPDFDAANSCLSGVKENLRYSLEINVFPNPSNNILMIECGSVTAANITIVSSLGQIVLQKNMIDIKQELDVSHLKPGLYFLEVEAGLKKGRIKFLKE